MYTITTLALALVASTASAELITGTAFTLRTQQIGWFGGSPSFDTVGVSFDERGGAILGVDNFAVFTYNGTASDIEKGLSGIVNTQSHKTLVINKYPMYTPNDIIEAQPLPDGTFYVDPRHGTTLERLYLSAPQDPLSYLLPNLFLADRNRDIRSLHNGVGVFYDVNHENSTSAGLRVYPECVEPADHALDGLTVIPVRCYRAGSKPF